MSLLVLASAATASGLTLKYFDARGAAETTRVLLAIGGIAYTDHRYAIGPGFEAPEFKADKESGALARNLGRAPLLLTDEGVIGQSKAMERYVAGQAGLMGKTPFDAACIDMVAEHVRDVRDAQARKGFSRMARGKTDEEKAALAAEWYGTDINPNPKRNPSPNLNPSPDPNPSPNPKPKPNRNPEQVRHRPAQLARQARGVRRRAGRRRGRARGGRRRLVRGRVHLEPAARGLGRGPRARRRGRRLRVRVRVRARARARARVRLRVGVWVRLSYSLPLT